MLGLFEFLADISREVFVALLIKTRYRIDIDKFLCEQFFFCILLWYVEQFCDIGHIEPSVAVERYGDRVFRRVGFQFACRFQHPAKEDVRPLDVMSFLSVGSYDFLVVFDGCDGGKIHVVAQE